MATKNKFTNIELDFAEEQLAIYKKWLDENPYDSFEDRVMWKETKSGGAIPIVASTKEAQQKNHRDTIKDYLAMIAIVEELREKEQKKKDLRKGFNSKNVLDDLDKE